MAIAAGANILGLVGPMPSGPGIISNETIRQIVSQVPEHIETFILTSETSADAIIAHHRLVKTSCIQIVDELKNGSYQDIREAIPNIKLIQVIHVKDENTINEALSVSEHVDYILLDSGNPNANVKTLGGTGNVHNWDISQQIVKKVSVPVFLAGGLKSENIQEAMEKVNPYGVDLCSGVRTDKKLDPEKLKLFFHKVKTSR